MGSHRAEGPSSSPAEWAFIAAMLALFGVAVWASLAGHWEFFTVVLAAVFLSNLSQFARRALRVRADKVH
jgi:hypothetical protein